MASSSQANTAVTKNLPVGKSTNVVAKAWMKYFVYYPTSNSGKTPKAFYINPSYAIQFDGSKQIDSDKRDAFGSIEVPDQYHFFMELTYDALYIVTARRNDLIKTVDSISIDSLAIQQNWDRLADYKGAVEDHGNFREGFCFKLTRPIGGRE